MTHTTADRNKKYELSDFKPYIMTRDTWDKRELSLLPNLTPMPAADMLNSICYSEWKTLHGLLRYELGPYGCHYGTIWLNTLQGGGLDGTGYVAVARYGTHGVWAQRFALCKHKTEYLPSANPSRGIHLRFCTLCGLDMSYDSSD